MKRRMRIAALLLAVLMCLLLTACGAQGGKEEEKDPLADLPESVRSRVIPWQLDAPEQAKADGKLHFYFMSDMGYAQPEKWGDSCLLVLPDGTTVLIDAGVAAFGPLLVQDLKLLGVETLDYLIISHQHADHVDGAYSDGGVLDSMMVKQVYFSGVYGDWANNRALEEKAAEKGVPCQVLRCGDTLALGQLNVEVLWPESSEVGKAYSADADVNNTSMVLRLDFGATSALFTGDIYVEAEDKLIDLYGDKLDVDLVKIPHHGARSSSGTAFAQATTPSVAVAMGYSLVPTDVYANYTATGSRVYLDMQDGFIHVTSDGSKLEVETSRERNTDFYAKFEYQG